MFFNVSLIFLKKGLKFKGSKKCSASCHISLFLRTEQTRSGCNFYSFKALVQIILLSHNSAVSFPLLLISQLSLLQFCFIYYLVFLFILRGPIIVSPTLSNSYLTLYILVHEYVNDYDQGLR